MRGESRFGVVCFRFALLSKIKGDSMSVVVGAAIFLHAAHRAKRWLFEDLIDGISNARDDAITNEC